MKKRTPAWILLFVVLIFVGTGSSFVYHISSVRIVESLLYDNLQDTAKGEASKVRVAIDGQLAVLHSFAVAIVATDGTERLDELVLRMDAVRKSEATHMSKLVYSDGVNMFFNDGSVKPLPQDECQQQAMKGHTVVCFQSSFPDESKPYINLFVPIIRDGRCIGTLCAAYSPEKLSRLLSKSMNKDESGSFSFICDPQGNVLVRLDTDNDITNVFEAISSEPNHSVKALKATMDDFDALKRGTTYYEFGDKQRYCAYDPIGINDWMIINIVPAAAIKLRIAEQTAIGLTPLLLVMIISVFSCVIMVRNERELTAIDHESRVSLMMSQLKPHFMYNALSAIIALIDIDPPLAKRTANNFSKYMRSNVDVLSLNQMVPFENEIVHTKAYVDIEKVRFPDEITFKLDIDVDDFLVPPLTVQPLVENAIKHGIHPKHLGTVKITTEETEDSFLLLISDNGLGFDVDQVIKSDKPQGIDNVRMRLEKMCGGKLEVTSAPGKGTVVTVTLPLSNRIDESETDI